MSYSQCYAEGISSIAKKLGVISFKRNRPGVERVYINSLFLKSPSRRF